MRTTAFEIDAIRCIGPGTFLQGHLCKIHLRSAARKLLTAADSHKFLIFELAALR